MCVYIGVEGDYFVYTYKRIIPQGNHYMDMEDLGLNYDDKNEKLTGNRNGINLEIRIGI